MNRLHRLLLFHDPKAGMSALVKARCVARVVARQRIIERLQRFEIKLLGFFIIADWNRYVFNHGPNIRVVDVISIAEFRPYSSPIRQLIEKRHRCLLSVGEPFRSARRLRKNPLNWDRYARWRHLDWRQHMQWSKALSHVGKR